MKLFCANSFTGEDVYAVTNRMQRVVDALNAAGHEAYCPVFDPHKAELQAKGDTRAIFDYAFGNIAQRDALVAVITSDRKSEGLLMEVGAALSRQKPVYLFLHRSAKEAPSHLPKLATKVFDWTTEDELVEAVARISR